MMKTIRGILSIIIILCLVSNIVFAEGILQSTNIKESEYTLTGMKLVKAATFGTIGAFTGLIGSTAIILGIGLSYIPFFYFVQSIRILISF